MVDSRGALAPEGRRADRLELRVPTTATQLPAVRAMAGDLAMRMDYDLDAVEDLRLAVDEACATLAAIAAGDAPLTVDLRDDACRAAHRGVGARPPTAPTSRATASAGRCSRRSSTRSTAGRATQADVPGGDGCPSPVAADRHGQVPARAASGRGRGRGRTEPLGSPVTRATPAIDETPSSEGLTVIPRSPEDDMPASQEPPVDVPVDVSDAETVEPAPVAEDEVGRGRGGSRRRPGTDLGEPASGRADRARCSPSSRPWRRTTRAGSGCGRSSSRSTCPLVRHFARRFSNRGRALRRPVAGRHARA